MFTSIVVWSADLQVILKLSRYLYIYAIYFVYRYLHDFGLGEEIHDGLISWLLWCFHYCTINSHVLKWKFSQGLTRKIRKKKTRKNNHVYSEYMSCGILAGGRYLLHSDSDPFQWTSLVSLLHVLIWKSYCTCCCTLTRAGHLQRVKKGSPHTCIDLWGVFFILTFSKWEYRKSTSIRHFEQCNSCNFQTWFVRTVMDVLKYYWL